MESVEYALPPKCRSSARGLERTHRGAHATRPSCDELHARKHGRDMRPLWDSVEIVGMETWFGGDHGAPPCIKAAVVNGSYQALASA